MAVAQGSCPSCGAPIEFAVGSSLAKVCDYCRATIVRSDRGLQNLGKVADLALTPSLIAVGDQGTLAGRPFEVLGRVQLDHGAGPWDEYYVAFDYGQAWGWLAYAQGRWYVTAHTPGLPAPPYDALQLEQDIALGQTIFRVAEIKSGTITSAEGELPGAFPSGFVRYYADLYGQQNAFATLDYHDKVSGTYAVFLGWIFVEPQMQVTQLGPRSIHKVKTQQIKCPACGGDVPKLSGDRAERMGCPYCGAVSDIALQQVVAQQERAQQLPDIPIGSKGTFEGIEYTCIAYVRRGTDFDGDHYSWEEYLIWSQAVGYRWLVKDPETGWSWVVPVNLAELDLRDMPGELRWGERSFNLRNRSRASVEYVLGEVYWKCEVGETTSVTDFTSGQDVLSRESGSGEVHWSYSTPVPWAVLAQGFGLPVDGAGGRMAGGTGAAVTKGGGCGATLTILLVIVVILIICALVSQCDDGSSSGSGTTYRGGSGVFYGGK